MDTKTLRRFSHLIKPALESGGGKIVEFFLLFWGVVKDLNVLLDIPHRLLTRLVTPVEGQLGFQDAPQKLLIGALS